MQVKKFEARTMKEALEMVKMQLGPDAIILGVKDNKKSFGLVGEKSIEITAAVTEETLHRKKFAESRIREFEKQKLSLASAKSQKDFINKMVSNYENNAKPAEAAVPRSRRYIDIMDDGGGAALPLYAETEMPATIRPMGAPPGILSAKLMGESTEVKSLKAEIAQLKKVLNQFQSVPQTMRENRGGYPGADYGLNFETSQVFEKLVEAGIHAQLAAEMLTEAQKKMPPLRLKNRALVEAWVARYILDTTKITEQKPNHKIQVFIGPPGSGKTTTLVKIASHQVVEDKKRVGILTADVNKVGAIDQMRIYSQILNVPFGIIRSVKDWEDLRSQLNSFDSVLVDLPGFSLKSLEENSQLRSLLPPSDELAKVHLVLEATAKDSHLTEMGKRYKGHSVDDVIFTGLDLSVQHGTIYSFMRRFDLPLHSFSLGPRVPEDFEMATKERVLDLIFKLTQIQSHPTQNGEF